MKIVNIEGQNIYIFWLTRGISRKFSGKMWFLIILKFTKKHGLALSLENIFLEKPQMRMSNWPKMSHSLFQGLKLRK